MIGSMISGTQASGPATAYSTIDEQDREQQIGCRHHAAGREEVAHRIEIAQLIGENSDRLRPLRHLHREHVFEDVGRQHDVDLLAGHIDDPATDRSQDEIEHDRERHADGKRDQRCDRAVRHHAIVHVHDEQWRRQRDDIDDESRDRDVTVVGPVAANDRPEPMIFRHVSRGNGSRVGRRNRTHEEYIAQMIGIRGIEGANLRRRVYARIHHLRRSRFVVDRQQDAR